MDFGTPAFGAGLLQIIGIDIVLSGDNALVIALACRSLPTNQRKWGILLGTGAAIACCAGALQWLPQDKCPEGERLDAA